MFFHLHCISLMRINKHFSESGRVALAVTYFVQCSYKLLQLTETLCVEMDYGTTNETRTAYAHTLETVSSHQLAA